MHAVPVTTIHCNDQEAPPLRFLVSLHFLKHEKEVFLVMLAKESDATSATGSKHSYIMTCHTHYKKWYDISSIYDRKDL